MQPSRTEFIDAHGLKLCVRHWGDENAPKLFMVHGWMDVAASFQFMVDCFAHEWHVIAPDLRGFGESEWAQGGYWTPDYMADLEVVLDHYSPNEPVLLVGHSLGGKIASCYAGVRANRVKRLVSMEGYGFLQNRPDLVPSRLYDWLDAQKAPKRLKPYANLQAVVARMMEVNPRLTFERADFLSKYWARETEDGQYILRADPKHKQLAVVSRLDQVLACWDLITAPTLLIEGEFSILGVRMKDQKLAQEEIERRASHIRLVRIEHVAGSGHMLQHDQPEAVAKLVESFMLLPDNQLR